MGRGMQGAVLAWIWLSVQREQIERVLHLPRAWIILSPLSDHGKFRRNRGKGKANSEISLEISSQLTAIAASGISQLRDYINVSNCPWWVYLSLRHLIAVLTPTDRCNISWWWVPLFKNEPCEELPRSVHFGNWAWCQFLYHERQWTLIHCLSSPQHSWIYRPEFSVIRVSFDLNVPWLETIL